MKKADSKKEHFRNEWKYLISTSEKEVLNLRTPCGKRNPAAPRALPPHLRDGCDSLLTSV